MWIGLSDRFWNNHFWWSNNERLVYTNWMTDEPNIKASVSCLPYTNASYVHDVTFLDKCHSCSQMSPHPVHECHSCWQMSPHLVHKCHSCSQMSPHPILSAHRIAAGEYRYLKWMYSNISTHFYSKTAYQCLYTWWILASGRMNLVMWSIPTCALCQKVGYYYQYKCWATT